ncbi:peptidoglycan-binding protein [Fodinisporobacter ferrooxydans]|uniref:Peptidoglycan-binding protein n=1 Tax=Fodinisporobacter ferrooxydans TaxID=2901836 RepID=A0ABY4CP00_9BACL|nr:peptidoglycan-binding protein [Alicyclobacillaceae bacterium MYW30-H2]
MARNKRKNIDELPQYSFHDIRLGDTGKAVAFTQWVLKQLGWYNGNIDGIFGQKTLMAVRKFQTAHNLTVSGVVDRPMRYALYGEAVDKGILKAMPTPYYVNNWKIKDQATETSHETTPGTSTPILEYSTDETSPQTGTVVAPTTPEQTEYLPEEYQTPPQPTITQQPITPQYTVPSQPFMAPQHPNISPYGNLWPPMNTDNSQSFELPYGMTNYWNQVFEQQQRDYMQYYSMYRWNGFDPYPYWIPWYS